MAFRLPSTTGTQLLYASRLSHPSTRPGLATVLARRQQFSSSMSLKTFDRPNVPKYVAKLEAWWIAKLRSEWATRIAIGALSSMAGGYVAAFDILLQVQEASFKRIQNDQLRREKDSEYKDLMERMEQRSNKLLYNREVFPDPFLEFHHHYYSLADQRRKMFEIFKSRKVVQSGQCKTQSDEPEYRTWMGYIR